MGKTPDRALAAVLALWVGLHAARADVTVDTVADADVDDGACSLREAIVAANRQVVRQLIQYSHRLRNRASRRIPADVREPLAETADGIRADAATLRRALRCPGDGR